MAVVEQGTEVPWGFEVRVGPDREKVWVQPAGELDLAAVSELGEQVRQLIEVGFARLIIDLRALSFIDVAGLRLLLDLAEQASRDSWRLSLIQGGRQPRRIFALTDTPTPAGVLFPDWPGG